jgi:hypothetical protein
MEIKALPGNMYVYTFANGKLEMTVILSARKKDAETLIIRRLHSRNTSVGTFSRSSHFNSAAPQSREPKPHRWELIHRCNTPRTVVQSD